MLGSENTLQFKIGANDLGIIHRYADSDAIFKELLRGIFCDPKSNDRGLLESCLLCRRQCQPACDILCNAIAGNLFCRIDDRAPQHQTAKDE